MVTLGIETSCDETACAVVQNSTILSNVVSSSVPFHEKYGGVIPEIASRFHIEYINQVTKKALRIARKDLKDLGIIAVSDSPGLPGSLLVGKSFAKALSYATGAALVGVNHLHAHIYANFLNRKSFFCKPAERDEFPFVGVVVSGGHTNIFICRSFKDFETIGRTKDDAMGESFDKVAKILGIGYPGGPKIEKYAKRFRMRSPIAFPRAHLEKDSLDFSFSGIKTAVFCYINAGPRKKNEIPRISWSFQEAVFDVLTAKIIKACKKFGVKKIMLGGGVISNMRLRTKLRHICKGLGYRLFYPPPALCVDNAAMVAGLGEVLYRDRS